jgi:hypothetical protein
VYVVEPSGLSLWATYQLLPRLVVQPAKGAGWLVINDAPGPRSQTGGRSVR